MKQIIAARLNTLSVSAVSYGPVMGNIAVQGAESVVRQPMPTGCTLTRLFVELSAAPGAGTSYAIVLMVNGSPSTLTVTISGTDTTGNDVANSVTLVAGDYISFRITPAGTPAAADAFCSSLFTGATEGESVVLGSGVPLGAARYVPIQGWSLAGPPAGEDLRSKAIVPTPGTFKKLYWILHADPGVSPEGYRITVRLSGASTALTSDITADDITGSDLVNTFTAAAGEDIGLLFEPLNSPTVASRAGWGVVFVPDTNGESLILGCTDSGNTNNAATAYQALQGLLTAWDTDETLRTQLAQAATLKKFYMELNGSPGAGKSYKFDIRVEGADTGITVTVADTATTGNDTANISVVSDGNTMDLESTPTGTPTARWTAWGLVAYIAPTGAALNLERLERHYPRGVMRGVLRGVE